MSTLSWRLNQCWGYNRDAKWTHKARDGLQTVLQVTFCPEHTLYAVNLFPSSNLLCLPAMQMQEGNLRPVTKETKQVLAWVILSLEGPWVNFLWWKLQWWLIHFWHPMHKGWRINFKLNLSFFPQHWQVKAENDSLCLGLGLQENPCCLLREGRREAEASEWRKSVGDKSIIWPSKRSWKKDWMFKWYSLVLNPIR